jgi:heavy metal sensor kinase
MFFDRMRKLRQTLAFRLTLWYATLFVISAALVFSLFYFLIANALRQRIDVELTSQAAQLRTVYAIEGIEMLQRSALLQIQSAGEKKTFLRLFYPSGIVFTSSNVTFWKKIGIARDAVEELLQSQEPVLRTERFAHDYPVRVLYARVGSEIIVQLGYAMESEGRLLQTFMRIFWFTITPMLGLAVGVGWFLARRALSGVASITRTARRISQEDLDTRVPVMNRHDEIDSLAVTFNQMLDRIRTLVITTRQMNDNIAHDLRSPLTRIRGLAEVTLTSGAGPEEYAQMAADTIEECDRLLVMINTMLTIARTEAGVENLQSEIIDFSTLVQRACELFQVPAEDKKIRIEPHLSAGIQVQGDAGMLQRMVANLIDNAVCYTDPGGRVDVTLGQDAAGGVSLTVADTGMGIAPEAQALVFDRFYRGDRSRSRGGFGLGLSLARAIARAHGGDITLQSARGQGSIFRVALVAGAKKQ